MILLSIATAIQFVVLLALALVVLSLARQVGILHERLSPAGMTRARSAVEPGDPLPSLELTSLTGMPVGLHGAPSALLFVAADCPICRSVLPAFDRAIAEHGLRGFWVADGLPGRDGELPDYASYATERGLDPDSFLVSQELGLVLGIRQIPALVLLDDDARLIRRETVSGPGELARVMRPADQLATPSGEKST